MINLQLRVEGKNIRIDELKKFMNIDNKKFDNMIYDGIIPESINKNILYPNNFIFNLKKFNYLNSFKSIKFDKNYFNDIVNSNLIEESGGIFLISSNSSELKYHNMSDMIEKYGLWDAQGLNNHIHMEDVTKNVVYQMVLAGEIIEKWKELICTLKLSKNCVIYWNGKVKSTICIYLLGETTDDFLEKYDTHLGIKNVFVENISCGAR